MMQVGTTSPASAPTGAAASSGASSKASLQKAAQQFEAIFLRQMIGAMRSASLAEGISDNSATEQFQSMADSRTADALANSNAMGIAQLLMRQFGERVAPDAPTATSTTATTP